MSIDVRHGANLTLPLLSHTHTHGYTHTHNTHSHTQDAMVMELDVRWCGDPNITLAIELSAG